VKKLNIALTIVAVLTTALFIVTLSQNIIIKSAEVYSFYFNDSRAVDKIYTDYTSNQMADQISDFMSSFRPEKFDITENTGYDIESIFTEEDGFNMMCIKKAVDISFVILLCSFVLTVGIYYWLFKKGRKDYLRTSYKCSIPLSLIGIAAQFIVARTEMGREWAMEKLGMIPLNEESQLLTILGPDFTVMASTFYIGVALVIFGLITYIALLITRPPRIFHR